MDPQILKESMAAYQAVYSQEVEEDIEYLDEMGQTRTTGQNSGVFKLKTTPSAPGSRRGAAPVPSSSAKPAPSGTTSKFAGARDAAFAKAKAIKGSPVVGTKPAAPVAKPSAPAKPAATAPAAKPAASGGTRPAALPSASKVEPAKPAEKPSAMDTWAKANPRLAQAQKIRQQGGSRAEVNKVLYNKGTAAAEKTPTVVKASYDMLGSSNIKGMIEAYSEVYAPQEDIDEALTGDRIKKAIKKPGGTNYTRMHSADPEKRPTKRGGRGERGASKQHDFGAADRGSGNRARRRSGQSVDDTRYEEFDIFDVVLEFLQAEGYAETLEEAEWIMANELDAEDIDIILGEEQLDETIRNPESRKKLRAIMDREVVKGDKSKGQNPRKKYHTKTGNQAFSLLVKRDETDAPKAPVRKRGGTSAPPEERPSKSERTQSAKYWAGVAGPTRDRGAGNRAARRAGKPVNDNRED